MLENPSAVLPVISYFRDQTATQISHILEALGADIAEMHDHDDVRSVLNFLKARRRAVHLLETELQSEVIPCVCVCVCERERERERERNVCA